MASSTSRVAVALLMARAVWKVGAQLNPTPDLTQPFPILEYPENFIRKPCSDDFPTKKLLNATTRQYEHFYKFTVNQFRAGALYPSPPNWVFDADDPNTFGNARQTSISNLLYWNNETDVFDQSFSTKTSSVDGNLRCSSILMDGVQRTVLAVNGQIPGPTIRVNEGDIINVRVCNGMYTKGQAITLHWHGMFQRGTPWMDGVAAVSQPGIFPLQCFTYRFLAEPAGTWWWHSHQGVQYSDGLYGPLIVDRAPEFQSHQGYYTHALEDATLMMGDWMHEDTAALTTAFRKQVKLTPECENAVPAPSSCNYQYPLSQDGATFGIIQYASAVINGRGRYQYGTPGQRTGPLSVFAMPQGTRRRFRIINAAMVYALELSIDDHQLVVIRADGFDIRPKGNKLVPFVVDSLIVGVGERFDVVVHGNKPDINKSYYIRVRTLEDPKLNGMPDYHEGLAVLKYCTFESSDPATNCTNLIANDPWDNSWEPSTKPKDCTTEGCVTLNCPWATSDGQYLNKSRGITCYGFNDVVSYCNRHRDSGHCAGSPPPLPSTVEELKTNTRFINWGFSNSGSANAKKFWIPNATALTNSGQASMCKEDASAETCTHTVRLEGNNTVLFVWVNDARQTQNLTILPPSQDYSDSTNRPLFESHPIHMHGHSFRVLRYMYPTNASFDASTKKITQAWSEDIEWQFPLAKTNGFKHLPNFTPKAWDAIAQQLADPDDKTSFFNLDDPPRKDTILIPPGGYVALSIRADNPGWWIVHCHIEPHVAMGMALVLNEWPEADNKLQRESLPKDFPRMASFPSGIDFSGATDNSTVPCVYRGQSEACENTFLDFPDSGATPCPTSTCPAPSCPACSCPDPATTTPCDTQSCPMCPTTVGACETQSCPVCPTTNPQETTGVDSQSQKTGFMTGTKLQLLAVAAIAVFAVALLFAPSASA